MDQIKIGKFISQLRNEKNLTQGQIAEAMLVTSKSVSRWENGKTLPDISILRQLAEFFDITLDELLNGERTTYETKKPLELLLFYLFVSITGVFVFPTLGLVAPTFIFAGVVVPILGFVKFAVSLFGMDVPYLIIQINGYTPHPFIGFVISVVAGFLLYKSGKALWRLLLKYVHYIGRKFEEKNKH